MGKFPKFKYVKHRQWLIAAYTSRRVYFYFRVEADLGERVVGSHAPGLTIASLVEGKHRRESLSRKI